MNAKSSYFCIPLIIRFSKVSRRNLNQPLGAFIASVSGRGQKSVFEYFQALNAQTH